MQTRTLGTRGLEVSALGLGCMGMSQSFGPRPPRDEMITFLRATADRGVTLCGFVRRGSLNVYTHAERVVL